MDDFDNAEKVGGLGAMQQNIADQVAYKKGKDRIKKIQEDPYNAGTSKDDGYASMSKREREHYKRGFREEADKHS